MGAGGSLSRPALLLDEHISPRVARALAERGVDAVSLRDWREGSFLGRSDEEVLRAARGERRALVTYDVRTVPPLLRRMAEASEQHAGVVFVGAGTIPPSDVGSLVEALVDLVERYEDLGGLALWLERP